VRQIRIFAPFCQDRSRSGSELALLSPCFWWGPPGKPADLLPWTSDYRYLRIYISRLCLGFRSCVTTRRSATKRHHGRSNFRTDNLRHKRPEVTLIPLWGRKKVCLYADLSGQLACPLAPVELCGELVHLELLAPKHEPELAKICQDDQIWQYLTSYGGTPDAMHRYLNASLQDYASGSALPFVIRAISDGSVMGMTRLKNLSHEHRNAVVGSWLAPSRWGSGVNTESKLLLLTHAFETLHCIRIEFHTDSRNLRSQMALAKMGSYREGILRSCQIMRDGSRRDTVLFSIIDTEWLGVKQKLLARLKTQQMKLQIDID
jgi:N-acetyltransferase